MATASIRVFRRSWISHLCGKPDLSWDVRYTASAHGCVPGHDGFLDYVTEQLERSGVAPAKVCFEITETAAITDLKHALNFMHALKQRGCRFVQDLIEEPFDCAIVQAVQQIGRVLAIKTIAESAETEPIQERLRVIGVDYAQGYAIARPEPLPGP